MARPTLPAILRRRGRATAGIPDAAPAHPDRLATRRPDDHAERAPAAARPTRIAKR
jgi:hypothetical protein